MKITHFKEPIQGFCNKQIKSRNKANSCFYNYKRSKLNVYN